MAVARYLTGVTFTDETPEALQPALTMLPHLAVELSDLVEAAHMVYDGGEDPKP